jgi:ribosome-binding protein aMBF1 (putative translation factor)
MSSLRSAKALPKGSKSKGSRRRKPGGGISQARSLGARVERMLSLLNGNIGERLATARAWRPMTQAKLAAECGLQPSAVAHFEAGRREPSSKNLRKLALALDVSADWLLGLPTMPTRPS